MTDAQAAYNSGVLATLAVADAIADHLEAHGTASPGQQSAATALRSLAVDGRALLVGQHPNPVREAWRLIADDPADSGVIECPACAGRLRWLRDGENGHLHGQCETDGCLR